MSTTTDFARCVCCPRGFDAAEALEVARLWENRMDGYCIDCCWARCDAYPGECPNESPRVVEGSGPQEHK